MIKKYSQKNEQDVILKLFNGKKHGVFLDIGANDGITLSNTYALAKYFGWSGLLVEASPKAYIKLLQTYQQEEFKDREFDLANTAIGAADGLMDFWESDAHLTPEDVGLLSTGVETELKRWGTTQKFEKIKVPVESVETMLSHTRFHKFDLVSIDIEGMELSVVPKIPFRLLATKVAVIEWNSKQLPRYNDIMYPQGYELVHMNQENLIYAQKAMLGSVN